MEQIIYEIAEKLKGFNYETVDKTTEIQVLNIANDVLYPLKEDRQIKEYTFSINTIGDTLNISIFITENDSDEPVPWDLTITKK